MKKGWHLFLSMLILYQPILCSNRAQELAAQFFNIVAAGLLLVTAKENKEQKVAAATALIASMSAMTQTALEEPNAQQIRAYICEKDFIEALHHELLVRIEQDINLKTLIENYITIYQLEHQAALHNELEQID